jgi:hypothetical protein
MNAREFIETTLDLSKQAISAQQAKIFRPSLVRGIVAVGKNVLG